MAERFDVFPQQFESGTRTYPDGSEYVELRFTDEDGRTACLLFAPAALGNMLDQLAALRRAHPGQVH